MKSPKYATRMIQDEVLLDKESGIILFGVESWYCYDEKYYPRIHYVLRTPRYFAYSEKNLSEHTEWLRKYVQDEYHFDLGDDRALKAFRKAVTNHKRAERFWSYYIRLKPQFNPKTRKWENDRKGIEKRKDFIYTVFSKLTNYWNKRPATAYIMPDAPPDPAGLYAKKRAA